MKASRRLIPLNCMDRTVLAFQEVNEPFIIHAFLYLEGEIDPSRLNQAIVSAQMAHPVMRTVLRGKYLRIDREVQDDLGNSVLTVQSLAQIPDSDYDRCLFEWMNKPLDLRKEFPFRVLLLRKNETQSTLVFTFHHSAADGIHAMFFIRKIIEFYNNEVPGDYKPPEDIRLSRKGDALFEFAQSQRARVKNYYWKIIYDTVYRLVLAAVPSPSRFYHDKSGRSRDTFFCNTTIGPEKLKQIEAKATSAGVEVNDILLASCYRIVDKWNRMHGKASNKVRAMVVVNISPKEFRHVVSNQVSWISPTTWPADRADQAKLLKKLRAYTLSVTMNRRAFSLIYFFYFLTRLPPIVYLQVFRFLVFLRTHGDCPDVTNIGVIWPKIGSEEPAVTHIGKARILNITGAPPVTTPWTLAFALSTYNRTLNISLTYRPSMFSREKVQELLNLYVEEVMNYQVGSKGVVAESSPAALLS
ncbi:MAG: condensation domain-containing protein [Chloroflexi bacterium]|nr:condensation domain-containing protein [Chloroflexota bacterium]